MVSRSPGAGIRQHRFSYRPGKFLRSQPVGLNNEARSLEKRECAHKLRMQALKNLRVSAYDSGRIGVALCPTQCLSIGDVERDESLVHARHEVVTQFLAFLLAEEATLNNHYLQPASEEGVGESGGAPPRSLPRVRFTEAVNLARHAVDQVQVDDSRRASGLSQVIGKSKRDGALSATDRSSQKHKQPLSQRFPIHLTMMLSCRRL